MKVIDLTHTITEDMPVYPGTQGPGFTPANSYERDGFKETLISFYSHTGTHMDAPAHIYKGGATLDMLHIAQFAGKALVLDCSNLGEGRRITMDYIHPKREKVEQAEFLIFRTGWDSYWGSERYFSDYPCIDEAVADYIVKSRKKGIGLDTIGLDPIADTHLPLHKKLLAPNETVIIENLTNLELAGDDLFFLCALPLKHIEADGSPIRAIALIGL